MPDPSLSPAAQPTWPLPHLQRLAQQRLPFLRTPDGLELLAAAAALGRPAIADASALARDLIAALTPGGFVGRATVDGEPGDVYRVALGGRPRRIALSVFTFAGQPEIVLLYLLPEAQ